MEGAVATDSAQAKKGFVAKALDKLEWLGNKLPDPAVLFVIGDGWRLGSVVVDVVDDVR